MWRSVKDLFTREVTLFDVLVHVVKVSWLRMQDRYNLYVKKYRFIDRMKGSEVCILVLAGLYSQVWKVTMERINAYSEGFDVVIVNPGGFHSEKALRFAKEYGFSYFESFPNNIAAAQNFVLRNICRSRLVVKMDDDVFLAKNTVRSLLRAYGRLKEEGYDIGFLAPVLNVNNYSYLHFLKTLGLAEAYEEAFEKPIPVRNWAKQAIWYDPRAAMWIWEKSLPLNRTAERFEKVNAGMFELIPVRFSISCILFERSFLLKGGGFLAHFPRRLARGNYPEVTTRRGGYVINAPLPLGDEESINFFSDRNMFGRFLVLDAFAGHLAYYPQAEAMLKWFSRNERRLLEDLGE